MADAPAHSDRVAGDHDLRRLQRRLIVAHAERVHAELVRELALREDEAAGPQRVEELGIVAREALIHLDDGAVERAVVVTREGAEDGDAWRMTQQERDAAFDEDGGDEQLHGDEKDNAAQSGQRISTKSPSETRKIHIAIFPALARPNCGSCGQTTSRAPWACAAAACI